MSGYLRLINRQRTRPVDLRQFREIVEFVLSEQLQLSEFDLTIQFVGDAAMARLNQKFLGHEGSTDVITLDYAEHGVHAVSTFQTQSVTGELFVCVDEALRQARRFRVPWTTELLRYAVHGILHLDGHDDQTPPARRRMKRVENQLVRQLGRRFRLSRLARKPKVKA